MGVYHSGFDVFMTQKFLYESDVGSLFDQMGGIGVSETVDTHLFIDPGFFHGSFKNLLNTPDGILAAILAFKKKIFGFILPIISSQIFQYRIGKDHIAVFLPFALTDQYLHPITINISNS